MRVATGGRKPPGLHWGHTVLDLRDLIRACKAEPDDDAPRLILADWLEEHGDADRAAFLRLQVQTPDITEDDRPPVRRWAEPWERLGEEIRATPCNGAGLYHVQFRRGFLRVRDAYQELYDRLDRILNPPFDWTWVEEIKFGSWHDGDWTPLFQSPRLLELNRLEFSDDDYRSNLCAALLASPYLATLRHLKMLMAGLDDDGAERLSQCNGLSGIRSLHLAEMPVGQSGARAMARSELWDGLRTWRVRGARFGDTGLADFAVGRRRPLLESLDLSCGEYSDDGLTELARSDRFPRLRELGIGFRTLNGDGVCFDGPGVEAILRSPSFSGTRISMTIISDRPTPPGLVNLAREYPEQLIIAKNPPRPLHIERLTSDSSSR
jgi:uncharacterized protein (TIGR02996 family)